MGVPTRLRKYQAILPAPPQQWAATLLRTVGRGGSRKFLNRGAVAREESLVEKHRHGMRYVVCRESRHLYFAVYIKLNPCPAGRPGFSLEMKMEETNVNSRASLAEIDPQAETWPLFSAPRRAEARRGEREYEKAVRSAPPKAHVSGFLKGYTRRV